MLKLIVCVVASATPLMASSVPQGSERAPLGARVRVVGCVEHAQRNGSLAGTGVGTTASPNTADREANSSDLLDRLMLTGATPVATSGARASDADLKRYALEGREAELTSHAGRRVEVTGTIAPPRSAAPRAADRAAAASSMERIVVESVKLVADRCTP